MNSYPPEHTAFIKDLFSGAISERAYLRFLAAFFHIYSAMESRMAELEAIRSSLRRQTPRLSISASSLSCFRHGVSVVLSGAAPPRVWPCAGGFVPIFDRNSTIPLPFFATLWKIFLAPQSFSKKTVYLKELLTIYFPAELSRGAAIMADIQFIAGRCKVDIAEEIQQAGPQSVYMYVSCAPPSTGALRPSVRAQSKRWADCVGPSLGNGLVCRPGPRLLGTLAVFFCA